MSMTCQTDLLVDDVIQTLNSQEEVAKLKQIVQAMQGDLSKWAVTVIPPKIRPSDFKSQ